MTGVDVLVWGCVAMFILLIVVIFVLLTSPVQPEVDKTELSRRLDLAYRPALARLRPRANEPLTEEILAVRPGFDRRSASTPAVLRLTDVDTVEVDRFFNPKPIGPLDEWYLENCATVPIPVAPTMDFLPGQHRRQAHQ